MSMLTTKTLNTSKYNPFAIKTKHIIFLKKFIFFLKKAKNKKKAKYLLHN